MSKIFLTGIERTGKATARRLLICHSECLVGFTQSYRINGGNGFSGIKLGGKNTAVAASFPVVANTDLMIVTDGGKIIRTPVDEIRIAGRSTAGVTLFRTADKEKVISATMIEHEEESEE